MTIIFWMNGEQKMDADVFKSPADFEPKHDHLQFKINAKHLDAGAIVEENDDVVETKGTSKKHLQISTDSKKEKDIDVPYKEPVWSGVCHSDSGYYLEILKNGCIVDKLNVCLKPFYVFGRQLNCDFQLEHPSISRHHAVLQYRAIGDAWELGWYLYDLGSTHGTFVNREKISPHMHLRLKVGYVLKFGGSSRMYILQGPDEDTETESPLTVTEIKQRAEKQKLAMNLSKIKSKMQSENIEENKKDDDADEINDENKNKEDEKETGINWGITDDVAEDEDDEENADESEKIDFEEIEKREQLYLDDPRKALKNFFDREGVDLKYEFFEKGGTFNKQWTCKVELPVETNQGRAIFAEATVSGGKKEACVACALEACRMLDAYGVLRKSNQESKKRKEKHWEDNDYYDSDEDVYLDRTGELERKRQKRMRRSTDQPEVDNYDSLTSKLNAVEEEMKRVQRQLSLLQAEIRAESQSDDGSASNVKDRDSLDSYMTEMSRHDTQEAKVQSSRLRLKMGDLKKESDRLKKLIKISKPTTLPPLRSQILSTAGKKPILTGSIKGRKLKRVIPNSDQQESSSVDVKEPENLVDVTEPENHLDGKVGEIKKSTEQRDEISARSTKDSQTMKIHKDDPADTVISACLPPSDVQQAPELQKITKREPRIKKNKNIPEKLPDYDPNDPDYAIWLPPDDQTGDGKTSLNEKLGY